MRNINKRKKSVIFTGSNEFPFGSAVVQRQIQLANILVNANFNAIVVNRRGAHSASVIKREGIVRNGKFNEIQYFFGSLVPFKSKNFVIRNCLKLIGFFGEFFYIFYCKLFKNAVFIFNNSIHINELKYYHYLSKIFRLKLVYDYVEFVSSLGNRDVNSTKKNSNSFDFVFYNYVDKIIVISTFLEEHIHNVNSDFEIIKIPPSIDFTFFDQVRKDKSETSFFLFCCSLAYMDLIKFVINSFKIFSVNNSDFKLKLILNGSNEELSLVNQNIAKNNLSEKVDILSKIPYQELIKLNKMASALLIPIGNNIQDKARFPFKICEYVASKSPIITTNVPLINETFKDGQSAYIAEINSLQDFSKKMQQVAMNPSNSREIGNRAYELGIKIFDYKNYIDKLSFFLQH